jgi:hypothetical protein
VAESQEWVNEMLDMAKVTGDTDLLITGHFIACNAYFWMGKLNEVLEQSGKVVALYDIEKHRHLVGILNHDPKSNVGLWKAICTWVLGYPDLAARLCDETVERARQGGHPFDLGFALFRGADVFDLRREHEKQHKYAEECERLGREHGLPFLWSVLAPNCHGVAYIREGKAAEGVASLRAGLTIWDATGGRCSNPYLKSVMAEGMGVLGELDDALQLIDEQIEQVERPGWEERLHYAEILRLKGWVFSLKDDLVGAEQNYLASLDWAREQQAKSWELRTSTSLARLWQRQGKKKEAHDLLTPVYNWFTEGFDTKDLKEAKALLEELAA